MANKAASNMENFLKDKDKDVKFKASKDILDRA
jgi:hypothetical protein